jgi:hypothetical protein
MNEIISAVGIEVIPPGETESTLLKKILSDSRVYNLVLTYLVEKYAADVIRARHPLERAALLKAVAPHAIVPAAVKPTANGGVAWGVIVPRKDDSVNSRIRLLATRGRETLGFDGDPDRVATLVIFGEKCPDHIAKKYREAFSLAANPPVIDPTKFAQPSQDLSGVPGPNYVPSKDRAAVIDKAAKKLIEV